jgi:peptidoglycan-associated lipoprotein
MIRTLALGVAAVVSLVSVAGCAKKPVIPEPVETTAARMPNRIRPSDELIKLCKITFNPNTDRAPKFGFDESEVLPQDRDVLVQIARCVTTGPLKGRGLALVGRADPRGETEYNMILGEQRAGSVSLYLSLLGVEPEKMAKTSRGELDAEGADEAGWSLDRRVDIDLQPRSTGTVAASN